MKSRRLVLAAAQMKFQTDVRANVAWICEAIASSAKSGADVVLFPECAVTGYHRDFHTVSRNEVEAGLATVRSAAGRHRCHVLVGCPTWRGGKMFNSLLAIDRQGRERFRYSKIHLTSRDQRYFRRGNDLAYFSVDRVPCTAIICHERRYPELVRLPVMLGAQVIFHPNAGLDALEISRKKRGGRDGIAVRAFENEVFYVFANSVGPQGDGLWSAGDSKIVGPDSQVLAQANNRDATVIQAAVDLTAAGRRYAREALRYPVFLRRQWQGLLGLCRDHLRSSQTGPGANRESAPLR